MIRLILRTVIKVSLLGATIAAGSYAGYKVATTPAIRERIKRKLSDLLSVSKDQLSGMSEEMVLKRAQLMRNPQINRDWVESQWDLI